MTDIVKLRTYLNGRIAELRRVMAESVAIISELENVRDRLPESSSAGESQPPKSPAEKPPREACADAIEQHYAGKDLPFSEHDIPASPIRAWNPRTIRAALVIASQRREKPQPDLPAVTPTAPTTDPLDMPDFLRRKQAG